MNKLFTAVLFLMTTFLFIGCIKDEPRNMEADITAIQLDSTTLLDPIISNNAIFVYVQPGDYDLKKFEFKFSISEGATAKPESGSVQDFTNLVQYTITSEDGQFSKTYMVSIIETEANPIPNEFSFENHEIQKDTYYSVFYDIVNEKKFYNWGSGNAGYAFTNGSKPADTYPTAVTTESRTGEYAARMETKSTGFFGQLVGKPIAAGNLFLGAFDMDKLDPRFGLPYNQRPVELQGYYKYSPGPKVTNGNNKPVDIIDSCDIYAVLYNHAELEKRTGSKYLSGANVLTAEEIVATARLENGSKTEGNDFVHFKAPFIFKKQQMQKSIQNMEYSITIVMSASKRGADFIGAVGSKLIVDDIKIITKDEK